MIFLLRCNNIVSRNENTFHEARIDRMKHTLWKTLFLISGCEIIKKDHKIAPLSLIRYQCFSTCRLIERTRKKNREGFLISLYFVCLGKNREKKFVFLPRKKDQFFFFFIISKCKIDIFAKSYPDESYSKEILKKIGSLALVKKR